VRPSARVRQPWRHWDEARLGRNLGVYVHVPFCLSRCPYCDFLTYGAERPPGLDPSSYIELLQDEIAKRGALVREHYAPRGRLVDTVFFGGGTPTFLPHEQLASLVSAVFRHFPMAASGVECTVEANPETLSPGLLHSLVAAGVNRLSIGVQAAQEHHLRWLGRVHRWRALLPRLRELQASKLRLSFDLMYGFPGLTPAEVKDSLGQLMALGAEHISAYELTIEQGTPLALWAHRHGHDMPGSAEVLRQEGVVSATLRGWGLYRYEVSNYARVGAECRHNLRYWRGGDYIGLGLGAASRIGTVVLDNAREIDGYRRAVAMSGSDADPLTGAMSGIGTTAPPADAFLRLRTRAGMPAAELRIDPQWIARGWVVIRDGQAMITPRGLQFADLLAREGG